MNASALNNQLRHVARDTERPQILVVDDENGPRQALRMLLKMDYDVLMAESVAEAAQVLEVRPVDVVVTDLRMPRQDGMELLRLVRRQYPDIQVIILTGFGHLDTAKEAVAFGAFKYVEKPFDNEEMLATIKEALDRKEFEQGRRAMEYLSLEANRFETLGHLMSGTMHDLGTPLSVIGTNLDLLLKNPDRADLVQRMNTMMAQVKHCNDLVRNTMGFLRRPSGGDASFDLNDVVHQCLDVARPFLASRNVATMVELDPDLQACEGDVVMVRQATLNLIYNACQVMEDQDRPRQLRIQSWNDGDDICLAVQDSGPGIPEELRERIFDTMYTTKGLGGTGLGLTVVRHVMQRHAGSITLEKVAANGARFVLRFPSVNKPLLS